jgi:hypothetical protein
MTATLTQTDSTCGSSTVGPIVNAAPRRAAATDTMAKPIGSIDVTALTCSLVIGSATGRLGLAGPAQTIAEDGHRFEASPFGFHPADVPPGVGTGDRWACAREIGVQWHRPVVYAFWFRCQDDAASAFYWEKLDESLHRVPKDMNILWNLSARSRTRPRSFLPRDMGSSSSGGTSRSKLGRRSSCP